MVRKNRGASIPPSSPPPSAKYAAGLGLPGLRQKRGVSLEQIADTTKISIRFLRAIESEEFEKLPGGLFSTSYIRQYAAAIGFDAAELIRQFTCKTAPREEPSEERKPAVSDMRGWFDRWLGIAAQPNRS